MEPLIHAATLAPERTRLRALAAEGARRDDPAAAQARLHDELAQRQRAELEAQLRVALDAQRAQARAEGHAAGLADGRAAAAIEGAQARTELEAAVRQALATLAEAHAAALARLEAGAGAIAFAAVCRLVGRHAASALFLRGLVEQLCAPLHGEAVATARLHPRDAATLRATMADDVLALRAIGLAVVADEALAPGGCVVESALGEVHGDLDSQLRKLHAVLHGEDAAEPAGAIGSAAHARA